MSVSAIRVEIEYCPKGQGEIKKEILFNRIVGFPKIFITLNESETVIIETCSTNVLAVRDPRDGTKPHSLTKLLNNHFSNQAFSKVKPEAGT